MSKRTLPRYPIYVPSKGRFDKSRYLTAYFLDEENVPFYLVVEPQEEKRYVTSFGADRVLVLPFSDQGSVIPARNWIKKHATDNGHLRHWQLDDNIRLIMRMWRGKRIRCSASVAFKAVEDFIDRYENVAIAGLTYTMFCSPMTGPQKPFFLNVHVYSCTLMLNSLPNEWRGKYNEDTDICLQVLADGWCTVLINAFMVDKMGTMQMKGGNTDELYHGDGRLKMARSLERVWPHVVTTKRRFQRPQHVIKNSWKGFDTPLKLKPGIDLSKMKPNEYGMKLVQVKDEIKSKKLKRLVKESKEGKDGTQQI